MNLLKNNLFQGGWFKQLKFLFSPPVDMQPVLYCGEFSVSLEYLPVDVNGCALALNKKMGWVIDHAKKVPLEGFDEAVIVVCNRSMYPLSPFSSTTKENSIVMNAIAAAKFTEAFAKVNEDGAEGINVKLLHTVLYIVGFLTFITLIIAYFASRG